MSRTCRRQAGGGPCGERQGLVLEGPGGVGCRVALGEAGIRATCPVTVPSWSAARDSLACLSSMFRFQPRHGVGRGRRG